MGTKIAGIYIPEQGETNWLGDGEVNDSLELLANRTRNLPANGTHGDAAHAVDYATVEGLFSGSHDDLADVSASDHHDKTTASDLAGVNLAVSGGKLDALSDSDVQTVINNDSDHGSTASHNYFSGSHTDLANTSTDDHHTKYTDSETMTVVQGMDVDAQTVDGYDIQIGGTEPTGNTTIWFDQA